MELRKTAGTVGKILGGGASAIGLAAGVGFFITTTPPGLGVLVLCFLGGCVLTAPVVFRDYILEIVLPIRHLKDSETIQKTFEQLVRDARYIIYDGPLDKPRADLFKSWIEAAKQSNKPSIKIFNTDPCFYSNSSTTIALETLVKLDKDFKLFECFHSFHHRPYSHLQIQDENERLRSLVIFGNDGRSSHALLIKNSGWVPVPSPNHSNVLPITFVEQAKNYCRVDEQYWRFIAPLKQGWFHPVFPPIGSDIVRRAWRESILRWFNSTAVNILGRTGTEGDVKITWLISKKSLTDANAFEQWLALLKNNTKLPVQRVLLIDFTMFKSDSEYRRTVSGIWEGYLPVDPNSHYKILVKDTTDLDPDLKRDFAILKVGNAEYAQNSHADNDGGAQEEVLRIFFSQAQTDVSVLGQKFLSLTADARGYSNYKSFENALINAGHK